MLATSVLQFGPHMVGSAVAGAPGDHHGGAQKTAVQARVRGPGRPKSVSTVNNFPDVFIIFRS